MRRGFRRTSTLLLYLLVAVPGLRASASALPEEERPRALFSLEIFVRHRRAARIGAACGLAAGFGCVAWSLAGLYGDCVSFALEAATASDVRRDIIALSASTALLALCAAAFDALAPPQAATAPVP